MIIGDVRLFLFFTSPYMCPLHVHVHTHILGVVEHLVVLAGLIQGQLSRHCYVGQLLLYTEDVAAHLLDAILINAPNVYYRTHQNVGNERPQSFKNVLQEGKNLECTPVCRVLARHYLLSTGVCVCGNQLREKEHFV